MPYASRSNKGGSSSGQGTLGGLVRRQQRDEWIERMGARIQIMGDCWVVDGKPTQYAQVMIGGKPCLAHRVAFEMFNRDTHTDGMDIHHTCRNPGCINPGHLEALNRADHAAAHRQLNAS